MAGSGGGSADSGSAAWPRRVVHFLHVHPTKRPVANWAIWGLCLLVVISVASNAGANHKSTGATATVGSGATSTSTVTAAVPTTSPVSPSSTVEATPTTVPAGSSGSYAANSAGVILPNPQRTPGATNSQVNQGDIGSTICLS